MAEAGTAIGDPDMEVVLKAAEKPGSLTTAEQPDQP